MSDSGLQVDLLTREEMDALFATLAEERAESERREQGPARLPRETRRGARLRRGRVPGLDRALELFAQLESRTLSIRHQRRVGVSLLGCEELRSDDWAQTLLPRDRLVAFELAPGAPRAWLLLGRPYFFTLLALSLGARSGATRFPLPRRPYSRIEERFLARLAAATLAQLGRALGELAPQPPRVLGLDEPEALLDEGALALWVASFDVSGLGELCRLRLALPLALFERAGAAAASAPRSAERGPAAAEAGEVGATLLDMPVTLHVEVGGAELSLARLAALRPGELIPLERPEGDALVVRIEGAPKFRAVRGALGKRLAVQVTQRL